MAKPDVSPRLSDTTTGKLSRLVRRICLLRELGDDDGAAALEENDLAALAQSHDGPPASRELLEAIFAAESERAAETALLAELIVARLTRVSSGREALVAAGHAPVPEAEPEVRPSGPPAIADLLDAMLAQDRRPRRRAHS
ncbi:MAG TPA: hypothetical protein VHD32_07035 [Candidatus Didemnitutus sp.]|nr:hypothetical protein [Candidatus Didemnitutus sp.]